MTDEDILLWSERQAALLQRVAAGEALNERPDWANIIEEVESVGREQLHAVELLLLQALAHMLKAEASPLARDAENWRGDARGFRAQARSTVRALHAAKRSIWRTFTPTRSMALPCKMDGQPSQPVPATCPLTLDELLSK